MSVTESDILKRDILIMALFAMFRATVNSRLFWLMVFFFIFYHFQVYLAASAINMYVFLLLVEKIKTNFHSGQPFHLLTKT